MRKKLCPICGEKITVVGLATNGRLVGSCGDAFYFRTDKLKREYWMRFNTFVKLHTGKELSK